MAQPDPESCITTAVPNSHITYQRIPAIDAIRFIDRAGVARANVAVSSESPNGTVEWSREHEKYTVIQQHVLYWDRDGDGMITPADVWVGFRDLGFTVPVCLLACTLIPLCFSYSTRLAYSYSPDPFLRIYVGGAYKAKHGSDSGVFDTEGRFVPQKFEDLFAKCGERGDGTLTLGELFALLHMNRVAADFFGAIAAFFEWTTTWLLIERDGRVHKEDLRTVYDGSLFWNIRENRRKGIDRSCKKRLSISKLVGGLLSDAGIATRAAGGKQARRNGRIFVLVVVIGILASVIVVWSLK